MTEKLIIKNDADLPTHEALELVGKVIELGKISDAGNSYCYVSRIGDVFVSARRNKESHTFVVWDMRKELGCDE